MERAWLAIGGRSKSEVTPGLEVSPAPRGPRRFLRWYYIVLAIFTGFVIAEVRTSFLQSRLLAAAARKITYRVERGPSSAIHYPGAGPYDASLGYAGMPGFLNRLRDRGYDVEAQARSSPWLLKFAGYGLNPIYREKSQAGLHILGPRGETLFRAQYPARIYPGFDAIPPLIVQSLLFIENREVLDTAYPYRNPSVEWDRLAKAMIDLGVHQVYSGHPVSGGSTLATQMEKLRHSPEGRTNGTSDKFRQMASASLRAYQDGEDTVESRRRIIRDYINSIPLAASPGYGEVRGLGDGLWAWFGADFDEANLLVASIGSPAGAAIRQRQAEAYYQVLSLLLALKKPTIYLIDNPGLLDARVKGFLRLLGDSGQIPPEIRDLALKIRTRPRLRAPETQGVPFTDRKATDGIRVELLQLLGLNSFYDLDRLDLSVRATLDADATSRVASQLKHFAEPNGASTSGLVGYRLLNETADTTQVIYSFTLFEHIGDTNLLRIQADNYNQPLNINEGTKLELGSTAKLRTLVHYLEIIAELHERYAAKDDADLAQLQVAAEDRLTRWALDFLRQPGDHSLTAMLQAAVDRTYSASPAESFFTGGGLHRFANFEPEDNSRVLTIREALHRSVNLVFIRLMRDLVHYHMYQLPDVSPSILSREDDPARLEYLERFADREGSQFMAGFWRKYKDLAPDEALETAIHAIRPTPLRLAVIFRSARPRSSVEDLGRFLQAHLTSEPPTGSALQRLYDAYGPDQMSLNDRGFLAHIHPLELRTLDYLHSHPRASLKDLLKATIEDRQEAYEWLHRVRSKSARDMRILTLLEVDAFEQIHQAWRRLGFPFQTIVPSYATAIGSSGDNPAALAELMGILVGGGIRYRTVRVQDLHFAAGTPLETLLRRKASPSQRVLPAEVAAIARQELIGVVEQGTARRAFGSVVLSDGAKLPIGGKTGTGDNRFEVYGPGNKILDSRVVNRTATFVFFIGDRFFGTITAFVPGPEAADFRFTSALPVQIFKNLVPAFHGIIDRPPGPMPGIELALRQ